MTTAGDADVFRNAFQLWENYNRPLGQKIPLHFPVFAKARYNSTHQAVAPPTTTIHSPGLPYQPQVLGTIKPPLRIPRRAVRTPRSLARYMGTLYEPVGVLGGPGNTGGGLGGSARNWRAVKLLGRGAGPPVVLWEYNGPVPIPAINKLAVKNAYTPPYPGALEAEGELMADLTTTTTEHIVRLLVNPARQLTLAQCAVQGLDPNIWNGEVRRLIMEYCPQGSLHGLLDDRIRRRQPFAELTLWRIFECLIDGLAVMQYEGELTVGPAGVTRPPGYGHEMVVHFDLKPQNIFGGDRTAANGTHPHTQIWKIGDFGLLEELPRIGHNVPVPPGSPDPGWTGPATFIGMHQAIRFTGSRNWFPPEQFSPRWNYSDYKQSTVCGKFGPWTNIWQMGAIMYKLACFRNDGARAVPEPCYPFNPADLPGGRAFQIRNNAAKGITYGTQLRMTSYTDALKDAIHECLYEEPAHRPRLQRLKARVQAGIAACGVAGEVSEGWQDLDMPESKTPSYAKLNPKGKKPCCRTVGPNTLPACGTLVTVDPENQRVRCVRHYDLNKFPHGT